MDWPAGTSDQHTLSVTSRTRRFLYDLVRSCVTAFSRRLEWAFLDRLQSSVNAVLGGREKTIVRSDGKPCRWTAGGPGRGGAAGPARGQTPGGRPRSDPAGSRVGGRGPVRRRRPRADRSPGQGGAAAQPRRGAAVGVRPPARRGRRARRRPDQPAAPAQPPRRGQGRARLGRRLGGADRVGGGGWRVAVGCGRRPYPPGSASWPSSACGPG